MLVIERSYFDFATFSTLTYEGLEWVGIEKPWKDNQRRISCIPEGKYTARRFKSPTPGRGTVWQLENVPGRDYIQIHKGNWTDDVIGCIAIGKHFGSLQRTPHMPYEWAIVNSGDAFRELMDATSDLEQLDIEIRTRTI